MPIQAATTVTQVADSNTAGREAAIDIHAHVDTPALVLPYLTVNHDPQAFLSAVADVFGPAVPVLGCSTQGIMGREFFAETKYIEDQPGHEDQQ